FGSLEAVPSQGRSQVAGLRADTVGGPHAQTTDPAADATKSGPAASNPSAAGGVRAAGDDLNGPGHMTGAPVAAPAGKAIRIDGSMFSFDSLPGITGGVFVG